MFSKFLPGQRDAQLMLDSELDSEFYTAEDKACLEALQEQISEM